MFILTNILNIKFSKMKTSSTKFKATRTICAVGSVVFLCYLQFEEIYKVHSSSITSAATGVTTENQQPSIAQKRLEFVHITKTGGSAIEKLAANNGITWGICHFSNAPYLNCIEQNKVSTEELYIGTPWHAPPKVINALLVPPKYEYNPYSDADLFAVVRNPYDRAISEYYCPFFGMKNAKTNDDVVIMNKWIQNMIKELETEPIRYYFNSPQTRKYASHKHFLNQVEYIYDNNGETELIQNVIHFEDLSQEFSDLMTRYNLDHLKLPEKETHGVNVASSKKFTYKNLTDETVEYINRYAAKDFVILGYTMVDTMDDSYSLEVKQADK